MIVLLKIRLFEFPICQWHQMSIVILFPSTFLFTLSYNNHTAFAAVLLRLSNYQAEINSIEGGTFALKNFHL